MFFPFRPSRRLSEIRKILKQFRQDEILINPDYKANEHKLRSALMEMGYTLRLFAAFISAYPDYIGEIRAASLSKAVNFSSDSDNPLELRVLPENIRSDFGKILALLYGQAEKADKKNNSDTAIRLIEQFEHMAEGSLDLRFEAAALERIRDNFFEDDFIQVAEPDWLRTNNQSLFAVVLPELLSLKQSSNKEKTAESLVKAITLMVLRDGFFIMPEENGLKATQNGILYIKEAPFCVLLSQTERLCLSQTIDAFLKKEYLQAAKAWALAKTLPPYFSLPALSRLFENADEQTNGAPLTNKISFIFNLLTEEGINPPSSFRFALQTLNKVQNICCNTLGADKSIWQKAAFEFKTFYNNGSYTAKDMRNISFKMSGSHAEKFAIRGKKAADFLHNPKNIPDMIKRKQMGAAYRFKQKNTWLKTLIILGLLSIAVYLIIS